MDLFKVWVPPREHLSVQAIFGAACFVLENLERQNSTHLAFFKHQNTKTSLYKLPKNHWVFTLLEILGSVRRKLQSTVSLDHPVPVQCPSSWYTPSGWCGYFWGPQGNLHAVRAIAPSPVSSSILLATHPSTVVEILQL